MSAKKCGLIMDSKFCNLFIHFLFSILVKLETGKKKKNGIKGGPLTLEHLVKIRSSMLKRSTEMFKGGWMFQCKFSFPGSSFQLSALLIFIFFKNFA